MVVLNLGIFIAHSWHVETCVLLGRKIPEDVEYAYLDYEPKKSAPIKGDATYSEIKE